MRNPFVDACKGLAMVCIVSYHYLRNIPDLSPLMTMLITAGGLASHIFFFFSGRGLRNSLHQKPRSWTTFLISQAKKIYLPAIICVTIIGLIGWIVPNIFPTQSRYAYFGHVFLYKMLDSSILSSFGDHFWFLSPLFSLYLLTPLLFLCTKKYPHLTLIGSIAVSVGRTYRLVHNDLFWWRHRQVFFLTFLWEFVAGMRCAQQMNSTKDNQSSLRIAITTTRHQSSKKKQRLIITLALLLCAGLYGGLTIRGGVRGRAYNDFFAIGLFGSLIWLLTNLIPSLTKRGQAINAVSYNLFLYHGLFFMIALFVRNSMGGEKNGGFISIILIILLGGASYRGLRLIEQLGIKKNSAHDEAISPAVWKESEAQELIATEKESNPKE